MDPTTGMVPQLLHLEPPLRLKKIAIILIVPVDLLDSLRPLRHRLRLMEVILLHQECMTARVEVRVMPTLPRHTSITGHHWEATLAAPTLTSLPTVHPLVQAHLPIHLIHTGSASTLSVSDTSESSMNVSVNVTATESVIQSSQSSPLHRVPKLQFDPPTRRPLRIHPFPPLVTPIHDRAHLPFPLLIATELGSQES